MKAILIFALFAACATGAAAEAPSPMSMTFSFRQSKDPCTGYFQSPEIRLHNVPVGAAFVKILLTRKDMELGGQEVPLSTGGVVPAGAIRSQGPCNPGVYTYSATVRSSLGQFLAKAEHSRAFPGDEPVQ